MHYWFQNLNKDKNKLFHFRGSVGSSWRNSWFEYELKRRGPPKENGISLEDKVEVIWEEK